MTRPLARSVRISGREEVVQGAQAVGVDDGGRVEDEGAGGRPRPERRAELLQQLADRFDQAARRR